MTARAACLFTKRLERDRFLWSSPADGAVTISPTQLGYLLSGIDWRNPQTLGAPLRWMSAFGKRRIVLGSLQLQHEMPTVAAGAWSGISPLGDTQNGCRKKGVMRAHHRPPASRRQPLPA